MHQLWIIAGGPNGSGKTTLTRRLLAGKIGVLNPDDIARELDPKNCNLHRTALQAGREALRRQKQLIKNRESFALETTFSGKREVLLMREAQAAGYKVNLIFVCTKSSLDSVGRIARRVLDGGHFVSRKDVERRYWRSLDNLPKGVALADRAWLLDNTRKQTRLVASLEKGRLKCLANFPPRWVTNARIPAIEQNLGRDR